MPGSGFNNRSTVRPNQQAQKRIPFKTKNGNWQKERIWNQQTPATELKSNVGNKTLTQANKH